MTTEPKGKPRHDHTPVHDLIVEFKCPKCDTIHHLPILVDRVQMLERDELGQLVKDEQGSYIPIRRVSFEYSNAPRVHPSYRPEDEEIYRTLYERARAEREYAERQKAKKEMPLAEQMA